MDFRGGDQLGDHGPAACGEVSNPMVAMGHRPGKCSNGSGKRDTLNNAPNNRMHLFNGDGFASSHASLHPSITNAFSDIGRPRSCTLLLASVHDADGLS